MISRVASNPSRAGDTFKPKTNRIMKRIAAALLGMMLALALPTALTAQAPGAAPQGAEVQAMITELQQLHTQLEDVQQQALQDPELSAMQEEISNRIMAEMDDADPQLEQQMDRISELEAEARTAQQAGNVDRLRELVGEAQQIQAHFLEVQQSVLEQPEVAEMVDGFQTRLETRMVELDPEISGVLERFRELEGRVAEAMGQGDA